MAMQGRELFNGSIPPILLAQIMKSVDFGSWKSVWVGCSGTFSFERAVAAKYPDLPLYGNDVSLISAVIASVAQQQPLNFKFIGKLDRWETLLEGRPYIDRAAALILCMVLAGQYRGTSLHSAKHWAFYERDLDKALERPRERLIAMAREAKLTAYMPGDFRDHLACCGEAGGGFIVSAPFVKGFYEGWFKFINENVEWQSPSYDLWDPGQFPALLDTIDGMGIPYIAVYKSPLEGRHVAAYYRKGMHPPFYVLTSQPPLATSLIDQPPTNPTAPFRFDPVDLDRIKPTSKVRIYPCAQGSANYVKGLFLQENITFTSGMVNLLIYVDDMLAGVLTYSKMTQRLGTALPHDSLYLLSDTSTTRYGRVSKLIALLATSKPLLDYVGGRIVHRPVRQVVTTVRSNNPVSMKYRSIFELISRKEPKAGDTSGSAFILNYASSPRDADFQSIYADWFKKHFKDDRTRKVSNSHARKAA